MVDTLMLLRAMDGIYEEDVTMAGDIYFKKENDIKKARRRVLALAMAAALVLALGAVAWATGAFGLRDLHMGSGAGSSVIVAGWSDAPEEQAAKEWAEYTRAHIADNHLEPGEIPADTDLVRRVGAFSPEAQAELEALLQRYGLRLPEQVLYIKGAEGLYAVCGARGFLPETLDPDDGYPIGGRWYRGGSFTLSDAAMLGGKTVRFDMTRSVKGYFTGVVGYSLDLEGMEEWNYTTASGAELVLALGPSRAAAMIPLEHSFVYIHFRSGSESGYDRSFDLLTREDLEAFVESIDLDALDSIG